MYTDNLISQLLKLLVVGSNEGVDFDMLKEVLETPQTQRYHKPFYVHKETKGRRRIVPAKTDLVLIQALIARWILRVFPQSGDYCYSGKGVLPAVKAHQGAVAAIVMDLKDAYDQITEARIRRVFRPHLLHEFPYITDAIIDLLTYKGTTPQGCVSTPHVFNAVVMEMDEEMVRLRHPYPVQAYTRYVDNICVSVYAGTNVDALESRMQSIATAHGFEISWTDVFYARPFEYLGTKIFPDWLEVRDDRLERYKSLLYEALGSPIPNIYRDQITGVFSWLNQVSGDNFPDLILSLMRRYYEKVRRPPESLLRLVEQRSMSRMF